MGGVNYCCYLVRAGEVFARVHREKETAWVEELGVLRGKGCVGSQTAEAERAALLFGGEPGAGG